MRTISSFRSAAAVVLTAAVIFMAGFRTSATDDRGKEVFDTVCSACHSLTPPALKAPPMIMVAGHYVDAKESDDAARIAMRDWLKGPAIEKSLLPAHAIERFGLMPPLAVSDDDATAVVEYIFAERAKAGSQEPRQNGEGEGMQHGKMQHGQMQHGQMQHQGSQMGQMRQGESMQCPHMQQGGQMEKGGHMKHGNGRG